jgi:hypothetical protein
MEVQKPFSIRGGVSEVSGSPHDNAARYGWLTLVNYDGLTRCNRQAMPLYGAQLLFCVF